MKRLSFLLLTIELIKQCLAYSRKWKDDNALWMVGNETDQLLFDVSDEYFVEEILPVKFELPLGPFKDTPQLDAVSGLNFSNFSFKAVVTLNSPVESRFRPNINATHLFPTDPAALAEAVGYKFIPSFDFTNFYILNTRNGQVKYLGCEFSSSNDREAINKIVNQNVCGGKPDSLLDVIYHIQYNFVHICRLGNLDSSTYFMETVPALSETYTVIPGTLKTLHQPVSQGVLKTVVLSQRAELGLDVINFFEDTDTIAFSVATTNPPEAKDVATIKLTFAIKDIICLNGRFLIIKQQAAANSPHRFHFYRLNSTWSAPGAHSIQDIVSPGRLQPIPDASFLNYFYLHSERQDIFEFKHNSNGKVITYRYNKNTMLLDKMVDQWSEIPTELSSNDFIKFARFSSSDYFIHIGLKKTSSTTHYSLQVFVSPKKYRMKSRVHDFEAKVPISTHNKFDDFYWDEMENMLYYIRGFGADGTNKIFVQREEFKIRKPQLTINLLEGPMLPDKVWSQVVPNKYEAVKWPQPPKTKCPFHGYFSLAFLNETKKKTNFILCANFKIKTGEFFFYNFNANGDKLEVNDTLPTQIRRNIDLTEIYKGSFLKLTPQGQLPNPRAEIDNDYLDMTNIYNVVLMKGKGEQNYLESIYGMETEDDNNMKHLILILSTPYENSVYHGRSHGSNKTLALIHNQTDFRTLKAFAPVNSTAIFVQVEELSYNLNYNFTANKVSVIDNPSKGFNGVCSTSAVINHGKLGKVLVCFFESKAYVQLIGKKEDEIRPMIIAPKAQEHLRNSKIMNVLTSEEYPYQLFLFVSSLKPSTSGTTPGPIIIVLKLEGAKTLKLSLIKYIETRAIKAQTEEAGSAFLQVDAVPSFSDLIDLQFAGDMLCMLYRITSKITGIQNIISTFTFDADLFLRRRYSIILPNEILLSSIQTRLFMTDMPSRRAMSDSYLNTVLNVKKKEYQLSFAVQLDKGGITKQIAVFNPHFLPLDSLSLISLPSDYSIIDFGTIYKMTGDYEERRLAILSIKKTQLTNLNDFSNLNFEIFLVTDLTPSILLKVLRVPEDVLATNSTSPTQNFMFNINSSIYTQNEIATNGNREERDKRVFQEIQATYKIEYAPWFKGFAPKPNLDTRTANTIPPITEIHRSLKFNTTNASDGTAKIENFFLRLNPRNFVDGAIKSYNGTTNSFIEEYMKIVDVLNQTSEAPFRNEKSKTKVSDIFTGGSLLSGSKITNHIKLRFFAQRTKHLLNMGEGSAHEPVWCPTNPEDFQIMAAKGFEFVRVSEPWNITKNVTSNAKNVDFKRNATGFAFITADFVAMLAKTSSSAVSIIITNGIYDVDPKKDLYKEIELYNFTGLTLNVEDLAMNVYKVRNNHYLFVITEYNPNLHLYTKVRIVYAKLDFTDKTDSSSWIKEKGANKTALLAELFTTTNNIRLAFTSEDENNARLDMFLLRWTDYTILRLEILSLSFKFQNDAVVVENQVPTHLHLDLLKINEFTDKLIDFYDKFSIITTKQPDYRYEISVEGANVLAVPVVISVSAANDYLLCFPVQLLKTAALSNTAIQLKDLYIAIIENPFIGFTKTDDNPQSILVDNMYFSIGSYSVESYFTFYKLEFSNILMKYTSATGLFDLEKDTQRKYSSPIGIHRLNNRPVSFLPIPNFDTKKPREHRMFYVTGQQEIHSLNFTSFINIQIRTQKVASKSITVNLLSTYNRTQVVKLSIDSDDGLSFMKEGWNFIKLILMLVISIALAIGMKFVIEHDRSQTAEIKQEELVRNSLKPFSRAFEDYLRHTNKKEEANNPEGNELNNSSSDSSQEEEEGDMQGEEGRQKQLKRAGSALPDELTIANSIGNALNNGSLKSMLLPSKSLILPN